MLVFLAACTVSHPPAPELREEIAHPFNVEATTAPEEGRTRVTVRVRSPGGELPVLAASLDRITATLDGVAAPVLDRRFEPGAHGCTVTFQVEGTGDVSVGGELALLNLDGSVWATLPLRDVALR